MTRRARYAETAALGRFPLRPGKPLVHRRRNGAWGWTCYCIGHHRPDRTLRPIMRSRHNCITWREAVRDAFDHVKWDHKTPAQYETEALEALYVLPATELDRSAQ